MTSTATTDRAVGALLSIMSDTDHAPRQRIEAAEHLLDYECPRAVIEAAKTELLSIVEDSETAVDTKLNALKVPRRVEARKVSPGRATVRDDAASIETHRAIDIARRRMALVAGSAGRLVAALSAFSVRRTVSRASNSTSIDVLRGRRRSTRIAFSARARGPPRSTDPPAPQNSSLTFSSIPPFARRVIFSMCNFFQTYGSLKSMLSGDPERLTNDH
jgi:hypothetical protein